MKKIKSNKGITLISLVITIIIMVVLAIASINSIGLDDGLIETANQAAYQYKLKSNKENEIIQSYIDLIEQYETIETE